ncbi:MAG: 50S ribosomal protein L22 [Candidatus Marinimicrobia bacterium]|nr:50S ribosomal protein L22 [Candidatus Neomarinimicrobiota bacterium]
MVTVKAKLKYLKIAPRKTRLLIDLIKGMPLNEAKAHISASSKKASVPLLKLLKSAESNALHNFKLESEDLYVSGASVDGGPVLKRYMPKARGRATIIRRRTSHVSIVLSEQQKKNQSQNDKSQTISKSK